MVECTTPIDDLAKRLNLEPQSTTADQLTMFATDDGYHLSILQRIHTDPDEFVLDLYVDNPRWTAVCHGEVDREGLVTMAEDMIATRAIHKDMRFASSD